MDAQTPLVHIVDATPAFRRGLAAALRDAGFRSTDADLLDAPTGTETADVVVVAATPGREITADAVGRRSCVAIVATRDVDAALDLLRMGVTCIAERDAPTEVLVAAVTAALHGHSTTPRWVLAAAVTRLPSPLPSQAWVTEEEVDWLRALAQGATVASLAKQIAYSERETFRLLHDLYSRMGVANRTEALMWATRHGLI